VWSGKGGRCVWLTTLRPSCAVVTKSGNLNFLEPSGPLQACNGTALPLPLPEDIGGSNRRLESSVLYCTVLYCIVLYCTNRSSEICTQQQPQILLLFFIFKVIIIIIITNKRKLISLQYIYIYIYRVSQEERT